jgi:hypothetical protein
MIDLLSRILAFALFCSHFIKICLLAKTSPQKQEKNKTNESVCSSISNNSSIKTTTSRKLEASFVETKITSIQPSNHEFTLDDYSTHFKFNTSYWKEDLYKFDSINEVNQLRLMRKHSYGNTYKEPSFLNSIQLSPLPQRKPRYNYHHSQQHNYHNNNNNNNNNNTHSLDCLNDLKEYYDINDEKLKSEMNILLNRFVRCTKNCRQEAVETGPKRELKHNYGNSSFIISENAKEELKRIFKQIPTYKIPLHMKQMFITDLQSFYINIKTLEIRIGMKYSRTKKRKQPAKEINIEFFKFNDLFKYNYHAGRLYSDSSSAYNNYT